MRGLKQFGQYDNYKPFKSHPTWVRGLKRLMNKDIFVEDLVAPYVGAWIETQQSSADKIIAVSRTLRGCVD